MRPLTPKQISNAAAPPLATNVFINSDPQSLTSANHPDPLRRRLKILLNSREYNLFFFLQKNHLRREHFSSAANASLSAVRRCRECSRKSIKLCRKANSANGLMSESDFSLFPASTTLPRRQMVVAGILKLHPAPPVKLEIAICALLREVGTEQAFADGCSVYRARLSGAPRMLPAANCKMTYIAASPCNGNA